MIPREKSGKKKIHEIARINTKHRELRLVYVRAILCRLADRSESLEHRQPEVY